ncbi:MAG: hypothetical protein ACFFAZ_09170 [Promethearchaeota archaeon]
MSEREEEYSRRFQREYFLKEERGFISRFNCFLLGEGSRSLSFGIVRVQSDYLLK